MAIKKIKSTEFSPPPIFSLTEFQKRRAEVIKKIRNQSGSGLFLVNNGSMSANISASRFRPDSCFYYLTGFREEQATLLISVTEKSSETILFLQEKNPLKETWDGELLGIKNAVKKLGVNRTFSINVFVGEFTNILKPHNNLYYSFANNSVLDSTVITVVDEQRRKNRSGVLPIQAIFDVRVVLDEMRLIKSPFEIEQMRFACAMSARAMTRAMSLCNVGNNESEVMGSLLGFYLMAGLSEPSYVPIVGSGKNSCVLHYLDNNQKIPKNSVTLIDAGGEYYGYCADITRTIPSGKKFTSAQKAIYEIVLFAQKQAILKVGKGVPVDEYHDTTVRVICEGLRELKLLKGSVDKIIETGDYKKFYMHQAGHYLGLDTHDVGVYKNGAKWRKFEEGMIVTVEPGIYIRAQDGVPPEFHNIGIRLEDDILITKKGNENLTSIAPIEIDEVEALKS